MPSEDEFVWLGDQDADPIYGGELPEAYESEGKLVFHVPAKVDEWLEGVPVDLKEMC